MKLCLYREDLLFKDKSINCSQTDFQHFKHEVQVAIKWVGKATFYEHGSDNYNVIYPPMETPKP